MKHRVFLTVAAVAAASALEMYLNYGYPLFSWLFKHLDWTTPAISTLETVYKLLPGALLGYVIGRNAALLGAATGTVAPVIYFSIRYLANTPEIGPMRWLYSTIDAIPVYAILAAVGGAAGQLMREHTNWPMKQVRSSSSAS